MTRVEAIQEILRRFEEKNAAWAEEQLSRCELNVDGEIEDYADIVEGEFGRA